MEETEINGLEELREALGEPGVPQEVLGGRRVPSQVVVVEPLEGPLEGPVVQVVIQVGPVACLHHHFRHSFQFLHPNSWDGALTFLKRV